MQPLKIGAILFGFGHEIKGGAGKINHRGGGNSNHIIDVGDSAAGLLPGHTWSEVGLPVRGGGIGVVGIESINRILHGGHIDHIVRSLSRNVDVGNIERLGIDLSVYGTREQLAKLTGVHIGGRQG